LIRERTLAGLKAARARGRNGGRPKKLSPKELKTIRTLLRSNEVPVQDIAAQFKVNRSTLDRNHRSVDHLKYPWSRRTKWHMVTRLLGLGLTHYRDNQCGYQCDNRRD
jgi:DNA invertase Pin-like site-specific DNA recombinase